MPAEERGATAVCGFLEASVDVLHECVLSRGIE